MSEDNMTEEVGKDEMGKGGEVGKDEIADVADDVADDAIGAAIGAAIGDVAGDERTGGSKDSLDDTSHENFSWLL